jgi:hypothetical protein
VRSLSHLMQIKKDILEIAGHTTFIFVYMAYISTSSSYTYHSHIVICIIDHLIILTFLNILIETNYCMKRFSKLTIIYIFRL